MRILHFHKSLRLEHGGVVKAVLDLCRMSADAGHEVVLASPDLHDVPADWDGAGGRPRRLPLAGGGLGGRLSAAACRTLVPALDAADVAHLHGMWVPANARIAGLCRRLGTPYVWSTHGMLDDWCMAQRTAKKRVYLALAGRRALDGAAAVHCTAEAELEQSRKWFDPARGVVAPLVMDMEPFADLPGPAEGRARVAGLAPGGTTRPLVLFLSRLHYKKGVEILIDAAGRFADLDPRPLVAIAGTGDDDYVRSLQRRTREAGLADHVVFPGFVAGREKVSLFEAASVFALPTSQENFGFVIFEALAAATPVVTTRGADTWPEVEQSGGGVIADPSPEAFAGAIRGLLADPARRAAMGAAGRDWTLRHLSAEAIREQWNELYERAAGRPQETPR